MDRESKIEGIARNKKDEGSARADHVFKLAADLLENFDKSTCAELELTVGDVRVCLKRDARPAVTFGRRMSDHLQAPAAVSAAPQPEAPSAPQVTAAPVQVSAPVSAPEVKPQAPASGNTVKSPIVGVYYSASAPGADPFVKVGSQVLRGDVLCIVEAMKMMNEIESEFEGTVLEVLVKTGEMVEYGQPIMIIG